MSSDDNKSAVTERPEHDLNDDVDAETNQTVRALLQANEALRAELNALRGTAHTASVLRAAAATPSRFTVPPMTPMAAPSSAIPRYAAAQPAAVTRPISVRL